MSFAEIKTTYMVTSLRVQFPSE